MSWIGGTLILNGNKKKDLDEAYSRIRYSVRSNANLEEFPNMGTNLGKIKLFSEKVFQNYDEAEEYLENYRNEWCRKFNPMVAFHSGEAKIPKRIQELKSKEEKEAEKYIQYKEAHSVKNFKAKYIGCERCGSKVNKEYIKYELCPVCNTDLRSKTTLETLQKYKKNMDSYKKQYTEAIRKLNGTGPVKYMVMYDEYVG